MPLSFYICRLDEIEILMQDLDRANQVGNYNIYTISTLYPSVFIYISCVNCLALL